MLFLVVEPAARRATPADDLAQWSAWDRHLAIETERRPLTEKSTGRRPVGRALLGALLAGEPCDAMVVTVAMVEQLSAVGLLRGETLHDTLRPHFRTFPNAATAMRELAATTSSRPPGCTRATEINHTEGVRLVVPPPARFGFAPSTPPW